MKKTMCLIIALITLLVLPNIAANAININHENLQVLQSGCITLNDSDILTPHKLKLGDRVGVIAPANTGTKDKINMAIKILKKAGFVPVISDDIDCGGYLGDPAGEKRANAFNKLVADDTIKAIICLRGGYGSMQILDKIDYKKFRENRPILVGYSDITALHSAIYNKAHVITFHGPMLSSNYKQDKSFECLFKMLTNDLESFDLRNIDNSSFKVLKEGTAKGQIVGGNMVLISSLMGTDYEIDTDGKILFLEELEEPPYKLDRILWQLKLAGKFDNVAGIIIGDIYECDDGDGSTLKGILEFFDRNVDVPVIYNVHAGHDVNPITIPLGAEACIHGDYISLEQCVVE